MLRDLGIEEWLFDQDAVPVERIAAMVAVQEAPETARAGRGAGDGGVPPPAGGDDGGAGGGAGAPRPRRPPGAGGRPPGARRRTEGRRERALAEEELAEADAAERMADHIRSGGYRPGDKLPSERGFMDLLGLSRTCAGASSGSTSGGWCGAAWPGPLRRPAHRDGGAGVPGHGAAPRGRQPGRGAGGPAHHRGQRRLAPPAATPEDLAALRAPLEAMERHGLEPGVQGREGTAFHIGVARAAHNAVLLALTEPIMALVDRARPEMRWRGTEQGIRNHRLIYDAIAAGDERRLRGDGAPPRYFRAAAGRARRGVARPAGETGAPAVPRRARPAAKLPLVAGPRHGPHRRPRRARMDGRAGRYTPGAAMPPRSRTVQVRLPPRPRRTPAVAAQVADEAPAAQVVVAETEEDALREIADARAPSGPLAGAAPGGRTAGLGPGAGGRRRGTTSRS